jgi:hypothetical protein
MTRKLYIRYNLYRLLSHRLAVGDTSLSQELAYARTLMSTYEVSGYGVYNVHH